MSSKLKYKILFILLVFISAIDFRVPLLNFWDELFTIAILFFGIGQHIYKGNTITKREAISYGLLILLIGIGLIGNILRPEFQPQHIAILKDIIAISKFPIAMLVLSNIDKEKEQKDIIKNAAEVSKVIVLITLVIAVVGYVINLDVYTDEVRIIKCFKFVFAHPTFFVFSYVLILAVLVADSVEKNKIFILLDCMLIFLAQRSKGYVIILFSLIIVFIGVNRIKQFIEFAKGKIKIKKKYIFMALIVVLVLFWLVGKSKLEYYAQYAFTAARPALHLVGLIIMFQMFPIGSGLGTFGSVISGEYYSNVYAKYGISGVLGMTRDYYNYIGDVFWPYIYGQFGILGLVIYIKLILNLFFMQVKKITDYNKFLAVVILWVYAIFSTTAEAFFTNATGMQMAICLMYFVGCDYEKEKFYETNNQKMYLLYE